MPSLPSLTVLGNDVDPDLVPDHIPEDPHPKVAADMGTVADKKKSNLKSAAAATAKLLLRGVRDTADAFGPLKSVAGGLCFILENCEVCPISCLHCVRPLQVPQRTKANGQAIESLAPRVGALAGRLCENIPDGDVKEIKRREKLGE